jgi:hypothetical protein
MHLLLRWVLPYLFTLEWLGYWNTSIILNFNEKEGSQSGNYKEICLNRAYLERYTFLLDY